MNDYEFDLLIHDWIPCLTAEGALRFFSILSVLENAWLIRSIEHESPVVRIATLRLLLAFCYRVAFANGSPLHSFRNWLVLNTTWGEGVPSQWIDRYLDEYHCRDRFRLFDEEYPFFQVAGLECKGNRQPEPASRLIFEQFAGTPTSLWEHTPAVPSVREAALFLVVCQAFGASASNTSNAIVGDLEYSPTGRTFGPVYAGCIVWLEGNSLIETLMLNLTDYDLTETDLPIWEKPLTVHMLRARQPQKTKEGDLDEDGQQIKIGKKLSGYRLASPTGPVQLYTWPSRAVRLSKPKDDRVPTIYFTQGLALDNLPVDPMKPYNREGKPINLQRYKAAWRDLHSILAIQTNYNRTVLALSHAARSGMTATRLNVAGIARGDEAAKVLFWRHERMPVPVELLNDTNLIERLGGLIKTAEQVAKELSSRVWQIAKWYRVPVNREPNKAEKEDIRLLAEKLDPRPAYWARLEKHFFTLLENLPDDWDAARDVWKAAEQQAATNTWRDHVKAEAQIALRESIGSLGTTARAIQAVARVRMTFYDTDLERSQKRAVSRSKRGGKR